MTETMTNTRSIYKEAIPAKTLQDSPHQSQKSTSDAGEANTSFRHPLPNPSMS
jgi:hypothetical protein